MPNSTIACYVRVSTDRQDADSQRRILCNYLRSRETDPDGCLWFVDDGISGAFAVRPGWNALMEGVRDGTIKEVVAYDMTRCGRTVRGLVNSLAEMQERGVRVVFVKDAIDTSTPMGRCMMHVIAAFAELERENTKQRTSDAIKAKIKAGQKWGRAKGNKWLDPERAELVKRGILDGRKVPELAREYKTSSSAIYRVIGNKQRVLSTPREPVPAPAE